MSSSNANVVIRKPFKEEYKEVFSLVKEIAEFAKMTSHITLTEKQFIQDATMDPPAFHCTLADDNSQIVGYALYYFVYSSFQGRCMFLEDIYVKEQYRGRGIGRRLYKAVGKEALDSGCHRMDLFVLKWNETGRKFHRSMGAVDITDTEQYHVCRIDYEALQQMQSK